MSVALSSIIPLEYQIIKSNYQIIDWDFIDVFPDNISFSFNISNFPEEEPLDSLKIQASLAVDLFPNDGEHCGCLMSFEVRGMFESAYSKEGGSYDEFKRFIRINAFSLLYGFIRSHAQIITSISPSGQMCLPCLDMASINEELLKSQE